MNLQRIKESIYEWIESWFSSDQYFITYQEWIEHRMVRSIDREGEYYTKEMLDFPHWSDYKLHKKVRGLENAKRIVKRMNDKDKGKKMYKYEKV